MYKRAIILAGGTGTRLRPYTIVVPKPLVPIGDYPIVEVVIRQLVRHGFTHITMAVSHQAELIQTFFGDGSKWGTRIDYSIEDKPLSTMAPLRLIDDLPEDFLVMNGDILTSLDYRAFYNYHIARKNIFTIASHRRIEVSEYGVLEIGRNNKLCGFKEKPQVRYDVSMGIYMANKRIVNSIPKGRLYGFSHLMIDLIKKNVPASVRRFGGYWLDIGRPDDYQKAIDLFKMKKKVFWK